MINMSSLTGQLVVDGVWIDGDGVPLRSFDPFRNEVIWSGFFATVEQVDEAVQSAKRAFPSWSMLDLDRREGIARRFAEVLKTYSDNLAELISRETGKPLWESHTEVQACVGKVQNSIDALHERRWTLTESVGGQTTTTRYRPLGVMSVLGPFNLPAHLPGAHIVPALLAGNTIVFKPSEQTPAVGEFLTRAWEEAGLPKGVLNLVHGTGEVAQRAVASDDCDGVLFTGSYRVGALLHRMLAGQPEKMLALEMGGNNALVFESCEDIDAAVYQILLSSYITSGQRCTCARRLVVIDSGQSDSLVNRLVQAVKRMTVGDPLGEPQPFMGTVISSSAAMNIFQGQRAMLDRGFQALVPCQTPNESSAIVTAGLMEAGDQIPDDNELFGPLLIIQRADNLDQAIKLANQTRYGLSSGIITRHQSVWETFINRIRAGIVNWNRHTTGASGRLPFGGIGASGNHRPSGFFAADYCSSPLASMESQALAMPQQRLPGLDQVFSEIAAD